MYKFLYNKTCDLIERIIFWVQLIVSITLLAGLVVVLCFGGALKWLWITVAVLWWVVQFAEGVFYFYKAKIGSLPAIEWSVKTETENLKEESIKEVVCEAVDSIHRLKNTAIDARKDQLIYMGLTKTVFAALMIVCLLI